MREEVRARTSSNVVFGDYFEMQASRQPGGRCDRDDLNFRFQSITALRCAVLIGFKMVLVGKTALSGSMRLLIALIVLQT